MTGPLVSVVPCGYNQGQCLAQATYHNIELVIADNGSTDDSREVARQYAHLANVNFWP